MMENPNALLLRQSWQAVAAGDSETLRELWAEDIIWHVTSDSPWKGDRVGHDAVLDYLADVGEAGEAYETSLEELMVGDEYAAMVCHVNAKRDGRVLNTGQVLLGRFKDGRIVEVWTLSLDPAASLKFWRG